MSSTVRQKQPGYLVPGMVGKLIRMLTSEEVREIKSVNFVLDLKIMRIRKNRTILTAKSGIHPTEKPYF